MTMLMTNKDALKSATIETAKLLRMEDKLGQIKPGMLADIIAVKKILLRTYQRLRM